MKKLLMNIRKNRKILIFLAIIFAARIISVMALDADYNLDNDDMSYIESGIRFAETGTITMHSEYPSAQIMPGMTWLIALLYKIFGGGRTLWLALKFLWAVMGTLTSLYIWRCVRMYAPDWCAYCAMLPMLRADMLWMDNLILTETPFLLAFTAMIYYSLKMAENRDFKTFWKCLIAYMCGLMLKANIAPFPLFVLLYLILKKYDLKLLGKQCLVLAAVVLCFVIPWSVRNYIQFKAFIPLTYGAGNPALLGTYQGEGYPSDEELDYETNVSKVVREKYAYYYDDDGNVKPQYARYVSLQADGIKARYRQAEWFKADWQSMASSYLIEKPNKSVTTVFYWDTLLGISKDKVADLSRIDLYLCIFAIAASFALKKWRKEVLFIGGLYFANTYIYCFTFMFDRYNASIITPRFILAGMGLALAVEAVGRGIDLAKKKKGGAETSPAAENNDCAEIKADEEKVPCLNSDAA